MKKLLLFIICLTANIGFCQQTYYSDVTLTKTGLDLKNELASKITTTHTYNLSYDEAREALKIVDLVPDSADNVYLLYGYSNNTCLSNTDDDHRTRDKAYFGGGNSCEWNREHTYPKSLGIPNLETSGPGADVHHLRASDVVRNGARGSLKFIDGSGNSGQISSGWYPGDEWKGDVARMMMYMYLRYGDRCYPNNVTIGSTNSIDSNMIDLLLEWNAEDPVSNYEDNRNDYLQNTSNTYGQGNRNPFIDNPNLATQIWGGPVAEDRWNTVPDTETPTTPTNLVASNITNTTVDLTWTVSTDNIGISKYEIFVDGTLYTTSTTNSKTVTGLTKNTAYNFTVYAKDAAGNTSTVSNTKKVTTDNFIDTEKPSTITDLISSNISSSSVDLNWTAATDNVEVTSYEVFKDGVFLASIAPNSYTAISLSSETTYNFTVYAKDADNNTSLVSNTLQVTTLKQQSGANDLFISEYVEGGGNNKAIEIANYTGNTINLSIYSIKKQVNGAGSWVNELTLSGSLSNGNVYSIVNSGAITALLNLANTTKNGAPIDFNGNDPVGLFKNGILIDIVGVINNSSDFAKDQTLRRKSSVIAPRTDYTESEWDILGKDVIDGIGSHATTLSVYKFVADLFNVYPNPSKNNSITIRLSNNEINTIQLFAITGQLIKSIKTPSSRDNKVMIDHIPSGVYLLKVKSDEAVATKRIIVE
ncbi:Por secretion system C-terminal sorting domain-containing protein [Lutibacter agarilyticus]|uniref:Por secretion system C-terminal sorting domain-containing protein n=1 Tax=Lutibacter agarilyticus TaxID=1109740 RepID=A0A238XH73_9FLAO|nr:endonuclease [Lutibacter agarilyticus]SNR58356.1 Por secretion system C-terminal sorting domain-containing protein [Lutibacter agarilyticus]